MKVDIFKDDFTSLSGLNIEIKHLEKMGDHLWRFLVDHPDHKYLDIEDMTCWDKVGYVSIHASWNDGTKDIGDYTDEEIKEAKVIQGAQIMLVDDENEKRPHDMIVHYVPVKWATWVYVITDPFRENDQLK